MYKKAQMGILVAILAIVVIFGSVGVFAMFKSGALGGTTQAAVTAQTTQQIAQATKEGEVASLKAFAYNETKDAPNTKIGGTAYFWKEGTPTNLLGGANTLSTSATISIPSVNVCDTIHGMAFNSYHYGNQVTETIDTEAEQIELPQSYITSGMGYRIEEDGATETGPSIDIGANEEDSFNKFVLSQTTADAEFRLKMVCFQSDSGADVTNITTIKVGGLTQVAVPVGRKAQQYCWEWAETQVLGEFDEIEFGPVTIKGDSDGCTGDEENVTVTYIDESHYLAKDGSIKLGVEDDSDSNSDVGATDSTFTDTFQCS